MDLGRDEDTRLTVTGVTLRFRSRDGLEGCDHKLLGNLPKVFRLPLMPLPGQVQAALSAGEKPLEESRHYVLIKEWIDESGRQALYVEMPPEVREASRGGEFRGAVPGALGSTPSPQRSSSGKMGSPSS